MTDEEAFALLRNCNPEGLTSFYIRYRQVCLLWALKNLRRPDSPVLKGRPCDMGEAADLYQDAVLVFYNIVCTGKMTKLWVKPSTYFISTMRNLWRNQNRRPPPSELPTKDIADEQGSNRDQVRQQVRRVLDKMGEPCRSMLELRSYSGFSFDEIATVMGYRNGAVVRNLISRCYKRFRNLFRLDPDDMDPYDPNSDIDDDLGPADNLIPNKPKNRPPSGANAAELPTS